MIAAGRRFVRIDPDYVIANILEEVRDGKPQTHVWYTNKPFVAQKLCYEISIMEIGRYGLAEA